MLTRTVEHRAVSSRSRMSRIVAALVVIAAVSLDGAGASAATTTPRAIVERFHASLLGVMKDADRLGYRGRLATLTPEVARAFHLPIMARIVAGRHWKTFSKDQKKKLVEAFGRMTTATYAHRFNGYGGERFQLIDAKEVRRKTVMVRTRLIKSSGEAIELDYLVRKFKSGWRVVDVYLKGSFSELATRRSEYSSVLRREGLNALIAKINSKVAGYEAEAGGR